MPLRPLAPIAVIGAGLLMMSLATHSASADDAGAPGAVDVTSVGDALVLSWDAPGGTAGLKDYDLLIADAASGQQVLERCVDADTTKAVIDLGDLGGSTELSVSVTAEYSQGEHYPGQSVRVSLPAGPAKPESAPAVRVEGRQLQIALPDAPSGVTGRLVQLYRDENPWKTFSVAADRAVVTKRVAGGHKYRVAYQNVNAAAEGTVGPLSAAVSVLTDAGPTAVRTVKLTVQAEGLQVRWSTAAAQDAAVAQYRVTVTKDGERVGSAYTSGGVRSVVLPGAAEDGVYGVTVVAKDAAGSTSAATTSVVAKH